MTRIILEKCYGPRMDPKTGKYLGNFYLGMIVVDTDDLTPERLAELRADTEDKQGWKKYRKVMKEKGYDIGDEDEPE